VSKITVLTFILDLSTSVNSSDVIRSISGFRFIEVNVYSYICTYGITSILRSSKVKHLHVVLCENIDQILPNKLHGPLHHKIGVTCVDNGHVFYTLLLYHDYIIHLFHNSEVRVRISCV